MDKRWNGILPEELEGLSDLAFNLWFGTNENAKKIFQMIDADMWEDMKHNPVRLMDEITKERWMELIQDEAFMGKYEYVMNRYREYLGASTWFQSKYPGFDGTIAYFSAEFGFHESLPIYSGGLGILAGDHCKSASDLGLPLVGVGLLYKKGYFRQKLDRDGNQHADYFEYIFEKLPIRPVLVDGKELVVDVQLPGRNVHLNVWEVRVGRISVYLLDSDSSLNNDQDCDLTATLYGGNHETRIQQEILLGVGGIRMLRALGIHPKAYHINEGHAAFISLERIREYLYQGIRYETAIELVRSSTIFTTHTPVPAGHDVFPMSTFDYHMGPLLAQMDNERRRVIDLGFDREKDQFNMTYLGLNTSVYRNGVSKLHGDVSRSMFQGFYGDILLHEVPIESITNGVHLKTWIAKDLKDLYGKYLSADWQQHQTEKAMWQRLGDMPGEALWDVHVKLKQRLIATARSNINQQRTRNGLSEWSDTDAVPLLNPNALTIGFARRFATYKRSTLIFRDLNRLNRIVNNPDRPVQIIFAGKSHPADHPGQALIREIHHISQMEPFKGKIIILENYDIRLARLLVQGVDVWLNNPKRPLEASGTSGMKAALNGVLNFSVLDGWWEEGYDGENGWEISSNLNAPADVQECENVQSFYRILEQEIVPLYYDQAGGYPAKWVSKMKRSIQTLAPVYNTNRMVQEYTDLYYMPTAERFDGFKANRNEAALRLADFKAFMCEHWRAVRVIHVQNEIEIVGESEKVISVLISLGPIQSRHVAVDAIYYEENQGVWNPVVVRLDLHESDSRGNNEYRGIVPRGLRYPGHYSIRVSPVHPDFAHRFDMKLLVKV